MLWFLLHVERRVLLQLALLQLVLLLEQVRVLLLVEEQVLLLEQVLALLLVPHQVLQRFRLHCSPIGLAKLGRHNLGK